jgi:hypothetical protein
LEREARDFENISKEGQSPSPHVVVGEEEIFEFPIWESNGEAKMKTINPFSLPNFHGLVSEDPNTFLFEFPVILLHTKMSHLIVSSIMHLSVTKVSY